MGKEILMFGDIEIEKNNFYRNKTPIFLKDVDIEKVLVCNKICFYVDIEKVLVCNKICFDVNIEKVLVCNKIYFDEKNYNYFFGYLYNDHEVKPLHILLPKSSTYVKSYDGQTNWIYFLIEDDYLLEKCNTILDKVSADVKLDFF